MAALKEVSTVYLDPDRAGEVKVPRAGLQQSKLVCEDTIIVPVYAHWLQEASVD